MAMKCPFCNAETEVVKTTYPKEETVRRQRRCRRHSGHVFYTAERREGQKITSMAVERSVDQVPVGRFDEAHLRRDLKIAIPGLFTEHKLGEIVKDVVAHLQHVARPKPLKKAAQGRYGGALQSIRDTEIRDAVETVLKREKNRMPILLYALSTRGRNDQRGRAGWTTALDVLEWMFSDVMWANIRPADWETGTLAIRPEPREWVLSEPKTLPLIVVKRLTKREVPFERERFKRGIETALHGRANAAENGQGVEKIVLCSLAGQTRVTSAQLSAGILESLRGVDEIAYLRWAVIAKNIVKAQTFRDEALSLLQHPPSPLTFCPPKSTIPALLSDPQPLD
jgi:transcriptional regulator NrdR family protein